MGELNDLLHEAGSVRASFEVASVRARVAQRRKRRYAAVSATAAVAVLAGVMMWAGVGVETDASREVHTIGSTPDTRVATPVPSVPVSVPSNVGTSLPSKPSTPGPSAVVYAVDAEILESPTHGPQLCIGMDDSLPPQCGGPDIVGLDWNDVVDAESVRGTTWGSAHLVGTWDVEHQTLTLTEPARVRDLSSGSGPRPGDPDIDPVVPIAPEDRRSPEQLGEILSEVMDRTGGSTSGFVDEAGGRLFVTVWLADPVVQADFDKRYGVGVVVFTSLLRPVTGSVGSRRPSSRSVWTVRHAGTKGG